ncbi:DeoR/GlpR family DNA-binding transcription regulator [Salinisphaera sp. SPP-AMP-43]|uniref:DeoR/GlpR family DNA-binding transcription regulator n=1 Tax=Salinisphaera sp. SPP-AMP-43 TaxID=3121288 RepID=UPI003C6E5840
MNTRVNKKSRARLSQQQRWERIQNQLETQPMVLISNLAEEFNVVPETVRRDIDAMAERRMLERIHGGAIAIRTAMEPSIQQRALQASEPRHRIAQQACRIVHDRDVLMMDSCATCFTLAEQLSVERDQLIVLTNSFPIAQILARNPTFAVHIAGGLFQAGDAGTWGSETTEYLGRFVADHCFSSCSAIDSDGPSEVNSGFAAVKRVMFKRARRRSLLVDHAKFRPPKLERVAALAEIDDLFTDREPPADFVQAAEVANLNIHIADE